MTSANRIWYVVAAVAVIVAGLLVMAAAADGAQPGETTENGVTAAQIDGTWVFHHDPSAWNEALMTGEARIEDGCLYVGDAVVVWHVDSLDDAEAAVRAALSGDSSTFSLAGGGLSLDEGGPDLPTIITDRCDASVVWFAGP